MTLARLLLATGVLAIALAGCASSQRASLASGPPASPAQGRSELNQLEQRIERDLAALGLASQGQTAEAVRLGELAARPERLDRQPSAGQVTPSAPPPPTAAPADALAAKSEARERASAAAEDSCGRDPCRYTRAICDAASRICEIARYLEEPDARARCGRALQDCQQARKATQDRCPGC